MNCAGFPMAITKSVDARMMRKANSVDAPGMPGSAPGMGVAGGHNFVPDEYSSSPEEVEDDEGGDKFIEISVSEPQRVGEGMSRYE